MALHVNYSLLNLIKQQPAKMLPLMCNDHKLMLPLRLATLTVLLFLYNPTLADFGDKGVYWSTQQAADFRDYAIRSFNRDNKILNNYWLHYWLRETFLTLNAASPDPISATEVLLIDDPTINAFAMPGNIIGINAGLWLAADNEDQLASVLAHEMAHVSLDHFSRLSEQSGNQQLSLAIGILVSVLIAQQSPEVANAALLGSLAAGQQTQLSYSREMETEADQLAQTMLEFAHYNPEAGRTFFQKLSELGGDDQLDYLSTHPLSSTRSAQLARRETFSSASQDSGVFRLLQNALSNRPQQSSTLQQDTEFNPHLQLAKALSSADKVHERLYVLISQSPDFLPAYFSLLNHQLTSDTLDCGLLAAIPSKTKHDSLTLDALDILRIAAGECEHPSYELWHSQWLWQSGRELAAIDFIKTALLTAQNTNQAAMLTTRLKLLNQRYARFN